MDSTTDSDTVQQIAITAAAMIGAYVVVRVVPNVTKKMWKKLRNPSKEEFSTKVTP